MKLTTIPSEIRQARYDDIVIGGQRVGKVTTHADDYGCHAATFTDSDIGHTLTVTGAGPTREAAVSAALERMSMLSHRIAGLYTRIVSEIA